MGSIRDDRGYNQGFKPSKALQFRTERRSDYIISKTDLSKSADILEIGCGTGELAYLIASKTKHNVVAIDLCLPFIEEARRKYRLPNLRFEAMDFTSSSSIDSVIKGRKFDYVVGNGILHHVYYKIDDALGKISRLLKDGGAIVFLEPNIINPYCFFIFKFPFFRKLANLEPAEMAFTRRFVIGALRNAGFVNVKIEFKDFLLPITPEPLISLFITLSGIFEKIPIINKLAQSIYIYASK